MPLIGAAIWRKFLTGVENVIKLQICCAPIRNYFITQMSYVLLMLIISTALDEVFGRRRKYDTVFSFCHVVSLFVTT